MHRCFKVPELLDLILSHLHNELPPPERSCWNTGGRPDLDCDPWLWWQHAGNNRDGHQELNSLARTCRLFHETALDHLWRFQPSIAPLLACAPQYRLVARKQEESWELEETFDGPSEVDWFCLLKYSSRIKRLLMTNNGPIIPCYILESLTAWQSRCGMTLTPNLKALSVGRTTEEAQLNFIRGLLSPSLRMFETNPEPYDADYVTSISAMYELIRTSCPGLSAIRVELYLGTGIETFFEDFLANVHTLKDVSLDVIPPGESHSLIVAAEEVNACNLWHTLALYPGLQSLEVYLDPTYDVVPAAQPSTLSGFKSLKYFCFEATWTSCRCMLELFKDPLRLEDIELTVHANELDADFAAAIKRACDPTTLGSICIAVEQIECSTYGPLFRERALTANAIFPFTFFQNLTVLSIEVYHGVDLDDTEVYKLASALPKLLCLRLPQNPSIWPRITHIGLQSIVEQCPSLTTLEIGFDATHVALKLRSPTLAQDAHSTTIRSIALTALVLHDNSPIGDPAVVAAFLFDLAPRVTLMPWNSQSDGGPHQWHSVIDVLEQLARSGNHRRTLQAK